MRLGRALTAGALALSSALAGAASFQYEALSASTGWLLVRENLPATESDTAACRYPGLDPSQFVGVRVHFVRLPDAAWRGSAIPVGVSAQSVDVLTARRDDRPCTTEAEARARWDDVAERARALGMVLPAPAVVPQVLGRPVPAKGCELLGSGGGASCRAVLPARVGGGALRIGISLGAVPVAPDEKTCQFVGHRMVALVQVAGLDFGRMGRPAPGGVLEHIDCRAQQFQPLRLFDFGDVAVLLAAFRGANIADRTEHPFVMVFPAHAER